jgi:predicted PurR-regulated permease PerM
MLHDAQDRMGMSAPAAATARWARWAHRRDVGLALLAWLALIGVVLWLAAHVVRALLIVVIASLLAYALAPTVARLRRWLPRWLAILLVYVGLLGVLGVIGYFVVTTAVAQLGGLVQLAQQQLRGGQNGAPSPLVQRLEDLGIPRDQIDAVGNAAVAQLRAAGGEVVPVVTGVLNGTLDTVLILVLSVYLLIDGARVSVWLRGGTPLRHRQRIVSLLDTFQRIVGGYIRGQVALALLIGALVGLGMLVLGVPYAILLGVLAFVLEFIPILGTLVSGAICVLVALTQGFLLAAVVLLYFVVVHVIEGDVVGPRIVGKAVGLHPVLSIVALVAAAEVFGIWGALLASPVAGVAQAVVVDLWIEWRKGHEAEFGDMADEAVEVADPPDPSATRLSTAEELRAADIAVADAAMGTDKETDGEGTATREMGSGPGGQGSPTHPPGEGATRPRSDRPRWRRSPGASRQQP